ncbi:MAG: MmgE/PrpD family protein [Acidobacteria bacterium]|nr:MmgE/PrpD family protein [Acidobacteriota bacterium]
MQMTRKQFCHLAAVAAAGGVQQPLAAVTADGPIADGAQGASAARMPPSGVTSRVIEFISTARLGSMPREVVEQGKRCLIDGFGVVLAGMVTPGSGIVRDYVSTYAATGDASLLGPGRGKAAAEFAALANGAFGHAMDFDDTQMSTTPDRTFGLLTHPTVPALASALAIAESRGLSGARFLEAFLIGFEVECKIAEAINPDHYKRGFHSTGTIGIFASAAAAAKLLDLQPPAIAHTLAIASSLSSGIRVNFGTMTKPLHAGRAAQNGIVAAVLASKGFTGGDDGLDGPWGFLQVAGGGADTTRIAGALGRPYSIVTPGVSVKPYPCGSLSHPTMDAMLKMIVDHDIKPEQIRRIRVRAGSNILEPLRYKTARTELEAKFCLPFLITSLVLRRKAGIREFTDEFVSSAPVQRMMPLVDTVFDAEIEAKGFDKMLSVIEVELVDGRSFVQRSNDKYRGGPEQPFTIAELRAKFADCAQLTLDAAAISRSLELIEHVETLSSVRELIASMAPA